MELKFQDYWGRYDFYRWGQIHSRIELGTVHYSVIIPKFRVIIDTMDLSEKGRVMYMASRGLLEPQGDNQDNKSSFPHCFDYYSFVDYAKYFLIKMEQDQLRQSTSNISFGSRDVSDLLDEATMLDVGDGVSRVSGKENTKRLRSPNDFDDHESSSCDNSSSKVPYQRRKTLLQQGSTEGVSPVESNLDLFTQQFESWVDSKLKTFHPSRLTHQIIEATKTEYSIDQAPVESFSSHLHELMYSLCVGGRRTCRQKGTKHAMSETQKLDVDSRREFVTFLNDTLLFFERASPGSTKHWKEKMDIVIEVIIQKIFNRCRPIKNLDEILFREVKEAHKNSSAAYRRFMTMQKPPTQRKKKIISQNPRQQQLQQHHFEFESGSIAGSGIPMLHHHQQHDFMSMQFPSVGYPEVNDHNNVLMSFHHDGSAMPQLGLTMTP